jgi:hypothetical protein
MGDNTPNAYDTTQAQLREYARLKQLIEESEEKKEELRTVILDAAKAAQKAGRKLSVEPGDLRVNVTLGEKKSTSYKDVIIRIEEKECFYLNGGGKPVTLGKMKESSSALGKLLEASTEMVNNDRVEVKPNVPTAS